MIETGHLAAFLAIAMAVIAAIAGLTGQSQTANRASLGAMMAMLLAFLVLVLAFVRSDFSVELVATNSNSLKPLLYRISASWGNHEGSMLLWCLVMALYAGAAVLIMPDSALKTRALGIQAALTAISGAYLLFASNPFLRQYPSPLEGNGLNPLLQDPALAVHPPLLYLGYVGFSFVFSLAGAGMLARANQAGAANHIGAEWANLVRPWALFAFATLGAGIMSGSIWAYYELGWGGWWFWDPVENASLMPWLVGAALIHSLNVTARSGALPGWTAFLAVLAFCLSLLGAFLVRSGILSSVHTFALDPERGLFLLAILVIVGGCAFGLFALRMPHLVAGPVPSIFSRGGALILNNMLFSIAAGTVLVGTLYPLLVEASIGEKISVGAPYFTISLIPVALALLLLPPLARSLDWSGGRLRGKKYLLLAGVLAALTGALLFSGKILASLGAGLALWVMAGSIVDLLRHIGRYGLLRALWGPCAIAGASIAHIGLGALALGAIAETSGRIERTYAPSPGQSMEFGQWKLSFEGVRAVEGVNYEAHRARIIASKNRMTHVLEPEKRIYTGSHTAPTTEVAIYRHIGGHLYVALGEPIRDRKGAWSVRISQNPVIELVFAGMAMIVIGALLSFRERAIAHRGRI